MPCKLIWSIFLGGHRLHALARFLRKEGSNYGHSCSHMASCIHLGSEHSLCAFLLGLVCGRSCSDHLRLWLSLAPGGFTGGKRSNRDCRNNSVPCESEHCVLQQIPPAWRDSTGLWKMSNYYIYSWFGHFQGGFGDSAPSRS